jgi:hypothetical protein
MSIEPADRPENSDERHCREHGRRETDRKIDDRLRRQPCVLGHAEFGIRALVLDDRHLVEAAIGKPVADEPPRQPAAPFDLQAHAYMHETHCNRRRGRDEPEREKNVVQERRAITAIQRVVKKPVPVVDAELDAEGEQHQKRNGSRQEPGLPCVFLAPIAERDVQKVMPLRGSGLVFDSRRCVNHYWI